MQNNYTLLEQTILRPSALLPLWGSSPQDGHFEGRIGGRLYLQPHTAAARISGAHGRVQFSHACNTLLHLSAPEPTRAWNWPGTCVSPRADTSACKFYICPISQRRNAKSGTRVSRAFCPTTLFFGRSVPHWHTSIGAQFPRNPLHNVRMRASDKCDIVPRWYNVTRSKVVPRLRAFGGSNSTTVNVGDRPTGSPPA